MRKLIGGKGLAGLLVLVLVCAVAFAQGVSLVTNDTVFQSGTTTDIAGTFKIGGTAVTATAAEINASSDIATPGVAEASKAVVLGASKNIATITSATITTLTSTTAEIGHASDTTLARSGAGAITVEGTQVLLSGAALGTPASGTLTNATGLPLAGVVDSTTEALGAGTIELGHATDTTIARSGAGAVTVEGVQVILSGAALGTPSSGTLTNATGLPRAGLVEDALARAIGITPLMWQHNTTGAALTVAETAGTHDLDAVYITGEVANAETEISESQVFFYIPDNYVAGADIAVTFRALWLTGEDAGAASRIDCELSEMVDGVAVGDQIGTAPQVLTATPTTFTFTVTDESAYVAGDLMRLLLITTAVDDVGGAATMTAVIADTKILFDVKG